MPFYVYIIQSSSDNSFYKGFSEDYTRRLVQHNNGEFYKKRLFNQWNEYAYTVAANSNSIYDFCIILDSMYGMWWVSIRLPLGKAADSKDILGHTYAETNLLMRKSTLF